MQRKWKLGIIVKQIGIKMKKKESVKKRLHDCDFPGCKEAGEYRAPKDRTLRSHYWFCQKHVAEYNKNWDFLKGLTPEEIEQQLRNDTTWQRPRWKLGDHVGGQPRFKDPFDVFSEERLGMDGGYNPPQQNLQYPKKVREAVAFMDLKFPLQLSDVKKRYKQLAKKYHPDISKKDASLFQKLTQSYTIIIDYLNGIIN